MTLEAHFKQIVKNSEGQPENHYDSSAVVHITADTDGNPILWCIGSDGRLADPFDSSDFTHLEDVPDDVYIPAAPGWRVEWKRGGSSDSSDPIVGWVYEPDTKHVRALIVANSPDAECLVTPGDDCRFVYLAPGDDHLASGEDQIPFP